MPNCTSHVVAFYAALRIGAVVVEHNPTYSAGELAHQLADSGAVVALVWEKAVPRVLESLPRTALKAVVAVDLSADLPRGSASRCACRCRAPGRHARRCAGRCRPRSRCGTGWSPGATPLDPPTRADRVRRRPAAVHGRHHGDAEGRDAHAPEPRRQHRPGPGVDRRDARHGGRLRRPAVLPRLRPDAVPQLRDARRRDARRVPLVRPRARARHPEARPRDVPARRPADARPPRGRRARHRRDLTSFRYAISGAMALPAATAQAWEEVTGGLVIEGYGMTETSPVALGNPLTDARRPGTLGLPFPSTSIRVVDPTDSRARSSRGSAGAADQGPAGVRRLLEAARRDGGAAARRRLAAHGRHRHRRRDRVGRARRPHQGGHRQRWVQGVPVAGRGLVADHARHRRRRRRGRAGGDLGETVVAAVVLEAGATGSTSRPCAPGARRTWPGTRSRAGSSWWTSCPGRRWARCCGASCASRSWRAEPHQPRARHSAAGGARPRGSCRGRGPGRRGCRRRTGRRVGDDVVVELGEGLRALRGADAAGEQRVAREQVHRPPGSCMRAPPTPACGRAGR